MKALYTFDDSQYKLAIFLCHDALFLFFVYVLLLSDIIFFPNFDVEYKTINR